MRYVAGILGGLLVLASPAQAAHRAESKAQTISLISTTVGARVLRDTAPKGTANTGDKIWDKSRLRNAVAQFGRPKGALVGSDVAVNTILSIEPARAKVAGTATLPGGKIRLEGVFSVGVKRD